MGWRPAKSLEKLRDQLNGEWPNRSKVSDGMLGDAAHAATVSDHNPLPNGVVCAFDITHDPLNGVDIDKLSDALAASHDPRIKYLIANDLICVPDDYGDWGWHPYTGADPHTSHLHISVYKNYDDTSNWEIGEEEMIIFNEGDRKNKNTSLYAGEDRGKFKFAVGMPYKDADYAIMKSDEYKEDAVINKGDVANLSSKFGSDMKLFVGKTWKFLGYAANLKPVEYEEVTEKLYRKKG